MVVTITTANVVTSKRALVDNNSSKVEFSSRATFRSPSSRLLTSSCIAFSFRSGARRVSRY